VTPEVSDRVNRAWDRVEKWLAAHASATRASLPPGADPQRIAEAQRQIGVPIPPELIASLLRHDGAGADMRAAFTFPPFYRPISVQDIISEAKTLCDVLMSLGDQGSVGSWWHGQYVPFAVDNSGEALFLDQRPGHDGRLGEHDNEGDVDFDRWPPTLAQLLDVTAEGLETGHTILQFCRAHVTPDGTLDWEIVR
jgi:cell wall assembly regulator SMI1